MDPFRRCRAGGFDARELEPYLLEAFLAFGSESQKKTLDRLFDKTNELFDEYYKETRLNFCIAPDVFAHRNEVESELKGIKERI